jgi:hypothetical protein
MVQPRCLGCLRGKSPSNRSTDFSCVDFSTRRSHASRAAKLLFRLVLITDAGDRSPPEGVPRKSPSYHSLLEVKGFTTAEPVDLELEVGFS